MSEDDDMLARALGPTIVLTASGKAFAVSLVMGTRSLEDALDPRSHRLEVRGPLGRRNTRYLWFVGFDSGTVIADDPQNPFPELTADAQAAVNAWFAWEDTVS